MHRRAVGLAIGLSRRRRVRVPITRGNPRQYSADRLANARWVLGRVDAVAKTDKTTEIRRPQGGGAATKAERVGRQGWRQDSASLRSGYAVRALPPFSRSAFFPISAVFSGNAPIVGARSGTPPRAEGTQSGKEPWARPRNRTADAQRDGRDAAVRERGRIGPGNLGQGNGKGRSGGGLNWPTVRP